MSWFFWFVVVVIALAIIGSAVQNNFKKHNQEYSSIRNAANKTGAQVAHEILQKNGITDIKIYQGKEGEDHYDPKQKRIVLSPTNYQSASVTAASIAAHEAGHAIQWAREEKKIMFRDKAAPVVAGVNKIVQIGILLAFLVVIFTPVFSETYQTAYNAMLLFIVIMYGAVAFFYLITLPVELDASKKANEELKKGGYISAEQEEASKKLLKSAAYTYIYAFLATLVMMLMYIARLKARSGR